MLEQRDRRLVDGSAPTSFTVFAIWSTRWWASPPTDIPAHALSSPHRAATSGLRARAVAMRAPSRKLSRRGVVHGADASRETPRPKASGRAHHRSGCGQTLLDRLTQ